MKGNINIKDEEYKKIIADAKKIINKFKMEEKEMNKYESVIIVVPTLKEDEIKELENKYTKLINDNGELIKLENLGVKKLAYKIRENEEGLYIVFTFRSEFEFISELERQYRIDDNVIKFIVVKMED